MAGITQLWYTIHKVAAIMSLVYAPPTLTQFAHTTCVGQGDDSKCDLNRGLKITSMLWLASSCCSDDSCVHYHTREPRVDFLMRSAAVTSHLHCPMGIISQQVRKAILDQDHITSDELPANHKDQPNHLRKKWLPRPTRTQIK